MKRWLRTQATGFRSVVPPARTMAHQVEHPRIVEVHADHHQVELLLRQQALRLADRAREHRLLAGEDGGRCGGRRRRVRNEDSLRHVVEAVTGALHATDQACPCYARQIVQLHYFLRRADFGRNALTTASWVSMYGPPIRSMQ